MKVALINPNIVSQIIDLSGTGIPYMPIALSYLAAFLREKKHDVTLIDAFGEAPALVRRVEDKMYQGLDAEATVSRIPHNIEIILVYGHLAVTFLAQEQLIRKIRREFSATPLGVLENINKVNAYSLLAVKNWYLDWGVDYLIPGYLEHRTGQLLHILEQGTQGRNALQSVPGLVFRQGDEFVENAGIEDDWRIDLNTLPFPAWDLLPLQNYWNIKCAHAPFTTDKYLPLLSSRGCPFSCRFCVSSGMTANRRWNARSAANVADEVEFFKNRFGASEFHFEDLNPGVDARRLETFCDELIGRDLSVQWKFAQGTKLETLDEPLIKKMAWAGCTYISISPESGSLRLLAAMNKKVDQGHARQVVRWLKKYGIISQGCFVIGLPEETDDDRCQTLLVLLDLARAGLDDPAIFIITLMPGSELAEWSAEAMPSPERCTFTPVWREDYDHLARFRKYAYCRYLIVKLVYHPLSFISYFVNFLSHRFETKVEMTLYRKAAVLWAYLKSTACSRKAVSLHKHR